MKFDSSIFWSARYAKWIIISLLAILSFFILYEIISMFTFNSKINQSIVKNSTPPIVVNVREEKLDTNLFGKYIPETSEIKESKLNVELVGIIYSNNPKDSQVTIKSSDGEEESYKVGDSIATDALIKQISPQGVVVERKGVLESLSLPENELTFEPIPEPLIKD